MHEVVYKRLFRKKLRSREEFDKYANELTALMLDEYRKL
jgi:hypothetical protein